MFSAVPPQVGCANNSIKVRVQNSTLPSAARVEEFFLKVGSPAFPYLMSPMACTPGFSSTDTVMTIPPKNLRPLDIAESSGLGLSNLIHMHLLFIGKNQLRARG
jgi:hypothetical protein